ncbi:MAG: radical SAM protein [Candidatus Aminicenantes bacterium]|nr:radical SAM protein [Candidatus Aminicenantes bacterium]
MTEKINSKSTGLNTARDNETEALKNHFKQIWDGTKPLAMLFRTDSRGYLYDTGTNKILGCDDLVFELLEYLFSMDVECSIQAFLAKHGEEKFLYAAGSINDAVKSQNILKFKKAEEFYYTSGKCDAVEMIQSYLEMIILEVTEQCNLRCGYCIYNPDYKENRSHGKSDMSTDVAEKALIYLKEHSYKQDKVGITFYGGEPLLAFPLIEWCVAYSKQLFKNKKIDFSITTNGTLLTQEMAQFFRKNNFLVLLSIDGPEEIHNSFRKYPNKTGSYSDSMRGLRYLIDAYGDLAEKKLKLSMVYTPPFSSKRLDDIARLWEENEWIPAKLSGNIAYPTPGTIPPGSFFKAQTPEDKTMHEWAFEKFRLKFNHQGQSNPLADYIMEYSLTRLMQRPLNKTPYHRINLNGCCVPGARRLFVTISGNFFLCERISTNTPPIGNVYSGVDIETIKKNYIDRYMELRFPQCSCCWAARFCDLCFRDAFKDGVMCPNENSKGCAFLKNHKTKSMEYLCTLMEDNPGGLDYLMERAIH